LVTGYRAIPDITTRSPRREPIMTIRPPVVAATLRPKGEWPGSRLFDNNMDDRIGGQLNQNTVHRSRVEKTTFLNRFSGAALRSTFDSRWKILDVMAPIARSHGCSAARVALAWLLAKPVVTSIIVGAKRLDQLNDNLAAVDLELTPDEIQRLDDAPCPLRHAQ
jgi:predicted oxidoreductase